MGKYKVNRSDGWPVRHEQSGDHKLGEVFESDDPACEKGVEQGYLLRVIGVVNGAGETGEMLSSLPITEPVEEMTTADLLTDDKSLADCQERGSFFNFTKEAKTAGLKK